MRADSGALLGVAVASVLAASSFVAGGGLVLGPETTVEIGLTLIGGLALIASILSGARAPLSGGGAVALLFALAALSCASVIWSVQPSEAWQQANRLLAYSFVFAGVVAIVRIAPARWTSLLGGVIGGAVVVSAYALATKIFPGLNAGETFARLREPYGYWNAIGLTAALGIPPAIWLGARRGGHGAINALAFPCTVLLAVTLALAYSRGALLALVIGLAFWFAAIPLRLRGLLVLAVGLLGALPVIAYDFTQHALSSDNVALGERLAAGHRFGVVLMLMCALALIVGLGIRFAAEASPPGAHTRRRAGTAVVVALILLPLLGAGALAFSARGFSGTISHSFTTLTDPHGTPPSNDPTRLTAIGSARARYWNDALKIFQDHPAVGVGAGGYATARARYRSDRLEVVHAHGYVVQTLADLGIVGMAISLLGVIALGWAFVAGTNPFGWMASGRDPPYTAERIGLLTMVATVIVFGTHSLIDWTWVIAGNALVALLCAGWVAGRGPHSLVLPLARLRAGSPTRGALAAVAAAGALVCAWSQWQPLRSQHASAAALNALASHDYRRAVADATTAGRRNPLSVEPWFDLSTIQLAAANQAAARDALTRAVRLQPANASTWTRLAEFDLSVRHDRTAALRELGAALYLDPQSHAGVYQYLNALQLSRPAAPPAAPAGTN
ncbi:MAG: hypothetical protein NVSMB51_00050 [Solirubrobacteraceae bacterium]